MARPLRLELPGTIYHLTARGNAREPIFFSDNDRRYFLKNFSNIAKRNRWLCYAYCLMNNHYHLLLEIQNENLSSGMRDLNGCYTQYFNKVYNRVGHLFQGRFKSIIVQRDSHLLELCRYIVLNPVKAGIVKKASSWNWSSYNPTISGECSKIINAKAILSLFDKNEPKAKKLYRNFVFEGSNKNLDDPWANLKGGIILGDEEYVERFKDLISKKRKIKEYSSKERNIIKPGLNKIFNSNSREKGVLIAYQYGYKQVELANYLGVHYSLISKIISKNKQG